MQVKETVNLTVELDVETHGAVAEHPLITIALNGNQVWQDTVSSYTDISLDLDITEEENELTFTYSNKDPKNDVVLEDGVPVLDKRVEIKRIAFDEIALDFFSFDDDDCLKFIPADETAPESNGFTATKLSWNGTSTLTFTSPVYIWLLENL